MTVFKRTSPASPYWQIKFTQDGVSYGPKSSGVLIDGKDGSKAWLASKAAAQEIEDGLRKQQKAMVDGSFTSGMTLGEALERYKNDVLLKSAPVIDALERGVPEKSIPVVRNFKSNMRRLAEGPSSLGANTPLENITTGRLVMWREKLRESGKKVAVKGGEIGAKTVLREGLSNGAIDAYLATLSAVLGYAATKWFTMDPTKRPVIPWCESKKRADRRKRKPKFLTDAQVEKLLTAARAYNGAAQHIERAILFLLNTGARKTEAFALTWASVDLTNNSGAIIHFVDDVKFDKERYVAIPDALRDMLVDMKAEQKKGGYTGDKVFAYQHPRHKTWLEPKTMDVQLQTICKAAGVKFTHHTARHTLAVNLLRNAEGVSLRDIGDVLGHEDEATTQIYAGFVKKTVKHAVPFLDANWQGRSPRAPG